MPSQLRVMASQHCVMPSRQRVMPSDSYVMPSRSRVTASQHCVTPSHFYVIPSRQRVMPSDSCVIPVRTRVTVHHLPNPQGQTHSANYFKVNSFYCLRKEFALALFFCNPTTFLLRKLKTISTINIFLGRQLYNRTTSHLFFGISRWTITLTTHDGCGCG
jgi:hypothetical protein